MSPEAVCLADAVRDVDPAYAIIRDYRRWFLRGTNSMFLMGLAIPLQATIIPLYLMLDGVGQTDTLPGVIAVYLAVVLPFMIWTLRGFVANIPVELEEAAMIDGCTRVGAFLRITFPLVGPGLVATAVFGFIQAWNEYIIAYVLLSSAGNQTLTVWLASFTTNHGPEWGPLMAAATLTGLPVVAFFLIVQRYLVDQVGAAEEAAAMQKHASESSASAGTTNLGALLKAKLSGSKDKE